MAKFKLNDSFVNKFESEDPGFGFNGLGEMVYLRTYSRVKENGEKEKWHETIRRVVEWVFETQRKHVEANVLGWDDKKAQKSAEEMFERMFYMKFLPPGRGLWIAGTPVLDRQPVAAALNSCAFISTKDIDKDPAKPFTFLADMSMLGVGVGFDTKGANKILIQSPKTAKVKHYVEDSREGWVNAIELTLCSFMKEGELLYKMDYSKVRSKGEPIKGFGGVASGPAPLKYLIEQIIDQFSGRGGKFVTVTDIVDIMNKIGCCVVAGNVRRTAEIAIGEHDDIEFLKLKDYKYDPKTGTYIGPKSNRSAYGWTSNNSIFAKVGMNYNKIAKQISENGEPGVVWLENMKNFSRMCDPADYKDIRVVGANPCAEQSLESAELCCLVETFPTRNDSVEDYLRTLKFAYLYAKTVTLCNTHCVETNRVMMRNRRIGTSMSGVAQIYDKKGILYLKELCTRGYKEIQRLDDIYSEWLCVPKSIKTTSVKPSGTVSLLAGVTPGLHFPENTTYIRRMRLSNKSDMVSPLLNAGYKIEPEQNDPENTCVVEIPVKIEGVRKLDDVSMWEQLNLAAFMQEHWADNQVSATITFCPEKEGSQIERALNFFQYKLKGISFLPKLKKGAFHQMPYEGISEKKYEESLSKLSPKIKWEKTGEVAIGEKFCSNDTCTIN